MTLTRILLATIALLVGAASAEGANLTVCASGCTYTTIQAAVNAAVGGDNIILTAGTTYTEAVSLPNKGTLTSFITITSNAASVNLPSAGMRMLPAYRSFLPKIQSPGSGQPAITAAQGADHYKFQFIEFKWVPFGYNSMIQLGDGTWAFSPLMPDSITIEQCIFTGDTVAGQKRGVEVNGSNIIIKDSYFEQIVATGQDSQCIAGWNGPGPVTITNNYLECGAENILFGGSDPGVRTYMVVSGTPTTTTAAVTTTEVGHTLSELAIGQLVAFEIDGGDELGFSYLTNISSGGASGTLTFSPALSMAPDVGGEARAGVITKNVTIQRNHITKNTDWMAGVLGTPTILTSGSGPTDGTLPPGTYYYRVQAYSPNGTNESWVNGATSTVTGAGLGFPGHTFVTWTPVTGATTYRVWRGTSIDSQTEWTENVDTSFIDNGSLTWATASIPGASTWVVKNLFEIKAAQDVQVDSNILEYSWRGSDSGGAAWLKSTTQDGACWWCESKNITIEFNIFRHISGWLVFNARETGGSPANFVPPAINNVVIENNLVYDSNTTWSQGFDKRAITIVNGPVGPTINHNTIIHTMQGTLTFDGLVGEDLVLTNNLMFANTFGIQSPEGWGTTTLNAWSPGWTMEANALAGLGGSAGTAGQYPATNEYPTNAFLQAQFVSYSADGSGADYHIIPSSPYIDAGTDDLTLGADIDAIEVATDGVIAGEPSGLQITTLSIPNGVRTVGYTATFEASGGRGPNVCPAGAIEIDPGDTIQTAVTAAPTGATFCIKAGNHEQQVVTPKNNQIFWGETGAVMNGGKTLTGWIADGGSRWYVTGQTQDRGPHLGAECTPGYPRCGYPEMLWVDGVMWRNVGALVDVSAGEWFFDYGADRIYIGNDPAGHLIQTSVAAVAFTGSASGVEIRYLTIEMYANWPQFGAIGGDSTTNWIVADNNISRNAGVGLRTGAGMQVLRNVMNYNGQLGIGGGGDDVLVQDNEFGYNNQAFVLIGWEAGGSKFVATDGLVVRHNWVHHNMGPGLWTDINNINTTYEDNYSEDNFSNGYGAAPGIFHEISYDAVIRNNVIRRNGAGYGDWMWGSGILIAASGNVEIYGNWVEDNQDGIGLIQQARGSGEFGAYTVHDVSVHHNSITMISPGWTGAVQDISDHAIFNSLNNTFENNNYSLWAGNNFTWLDSDRNTAYWTGTAGHDTPGGTFNGCCLGPEPDPWDPTPDPEYTWSVNAGSTLPAGLTLAADTGILSGTPTTAGLYNFTIRVTDALDTFATKPFSTTVHATASIPTTTLPSGANGAPYSTTVAVAGDAAPYTWTLVSGDLPTGLSLNSSSGVISGTPSGATTETFTVGVEGDFGTDATRSLQIIIGTDEYPTGRPINWGPASLTSAALFRRVTAPTADDLVMYGDIWMNTSVSPPAFMRAISGYPADVEWAPLANDLVAGARLAVTMHTPAATFSVWPTAMAASVEMLNTTAFRTQVDLTGYSQARVSARIGVGGNSGSVFRVEYSLDGGGTWDGLDGETGPQTAINVTNQTSVSAWVDLAPQASADVLIRVMSYGGNGSVAPSVGTVSVQFR